jgi:hypothetical protein
MNLTELTTQHAKTLDLISQSEDWETIYFTEVGWNPTLDELRKAELALINDAETLTAKIHDQKITDAEVNGHYEQWLSEHDCTLSPDDGCAGHREEAHA